MIQGTARATRKTAAQSESLQAAQFRLISEISQRALSILDRDNLLEFAVQAIHQHFPCQYVDVLLIETAENNIVLQASSQPPGSGEQHKSRKKFRLGKGVIGHVAETGQAYRAGEVSQDAYYVPDESKPGIRSELAVPIKVGDRVLGVLDLNSVESNAFDDNDLLAAQGVADQLAIGLENARLFASERQRRRELRSIQTTAVALGTQRELEPLLDQVVTQAANAFHAEAAALLLWDSDQEALEVRASCGLSDQYKGEQRVTRERWEAYLTTHDQPFPLYIPDLREEPLGDRTLIISEDIKSVLAVPLRFQDHLIGILSIYSIGQPRQYNPTEIELAEAFAAQAAVSIANAQLHEQSRQYAEQIAERAERLALVNRISTAVSSTLDLDEILNTAVHEMARVFEVKQCGIILFDPDTEYGLVAAEYQEEPDNSARDVRLPLSDSPSLEHILETKLPLSIADARSDPMLDNIRDVIKARKIKSILIVPLIAKGTVLGTIGLDAIDEPRVFTPEEVNLAETIASQIASAIDNARLFAAEGHRRREAETLQAATQALSTTLDLQGIFEIILSELQQVVPYDSASVQQLVGDRMKLIGGHGFPNLDELLGIEFDLSEKDNPNYLVVERRTPLILTDAPARYEGFLREPHAEASIRSWLGVPLLFGDQLIGMLALDKHEPDYYTEEHARLASAFAAQAAIAIENARLYEETQQRLLDLTRVFVTSEDLSTSLDLDRVLHIAGKRITEALSADGCTISFWNRERDCLETLLDFSATEEWQGTEAPGTTYDLDEFPAIRQVLTTRQPLTQRVSDPSADPREMAQTIQSNVKSLLMVPMVVRDSVFGLLEIMEIETERSYTATEISLCQTLANQTAAALDNAQLMRQAEDRAREMSAFAAIGQAMTTLDLDQVLNTIAEHALSTVQAQIASVYLLDADKERLQPWSVQGLAQEELGEADFVIGEGTIGQVAQSGNPLLVPDTTQDDVFVAKTEAARRIRNTLTVPLTVKDEVIGTLEVCNKITGTQFTGSDQRVLTAFASQAGIAIDNARLYQQVSIHLEEVLLLNQVARAATSTLDFDEVVHQTLEVLLGTRNIERVNILMVDDVRGELWLHPALAKSDLFPRRADFRLPLGQGITGWVAKTGEPLLVPDVRQEPRYRAGYPDTLSELCVPLRVGDRIIGVLDVQSTQAHAYSEDDLRLLTTLASQLSTVIDNARLFEETQQRVRALTALTQVGVALNEAKDLNTVLDIVLEQALALLNCQEGSVILIDPPGSETLRIVAERNLGPELVAAFNSRPVAIREGTYKRAFESQRIVEVPDTASDPDFLHDVGSKAKEVTNVPLLTDQGAIGLIAGDGLPRDDTTRQLLSALADMAAVAIEKERLHQETANRLSEVSTLYTLSTQITSSLSLSPVLDAIVTILQLTLDCRACAILLIDGTGENLILQAASGTAQQWEGIARLKIGEGVSGRVIEERRAIYVPDTHKEPDFIFFDRNIRSLLVVPLIVRGKAIGTLSIDDYEPYAFQDEARLLTIAAAQAAVAIENARLHESLQTSYAELEQSYEELRQLDKMKSEFVQNISHELRTPLTFIKGYVELLLEGELGETSDEQKMALRIVGSKAESLASLVDDIISLQHAERKRRKMAEFSLAELGHDAVRSAQASALELGVTLRDEIPDKLPTVIGDRQRVGQVFDNLLQNALKFTDTDGTITVRMQEEEGFIRVEVKDTGIGIPPDQLARIFDRFYQVDGTPTRRFGGTGLGLAIVKQIVETHGGQVGVESEPGKGSLFYFTLPQTDRAEDPGGQ
jgi:GAF domain-containing protein/anti-sigma regulatory factor (Ser/Thr protein kinase)